MFDGAGAGFDFIDTPSLLISDNGLLQVIWKVQLIQGDGVLQPLSLYYARSEDGGHTFNDAEPIVEEPVAWREILVDGKGHLHLLWQSQELTTVWDQVSLDDGHTWQYPQGLPDNGSLAAATGDPAGRLHFVGGGLSDVGHWLWDGSRWESEVPLGWHLSSPQKSAMALLAVAINKQGKMLVILAEPTGEGDVAEMNLLYSTRTIELPPQQTTIKEIPTQTLLPPTLTPATATSENLSTPVSTIESEPTKSQEQTGRTETGNQISPLAMALLPVALLLLSILGIVIRRVAQAKDQ